MINERLEKLAQAAGARPQKVTATRVSEDGVHETVLSTVYNNVNIEKFAELLIKEYVKDLR